MFVLKCVVLILLQTVLFKNIVNLDVCNVRINEIAFGVPANAFLELSLEPRDLNCSWSGLRLLIFSEDFIDKIQFLAISDVIILDNVTANEHGLFLIGEANNSQLHHQFKCDKDSLHGVALLQRVDLVDSIYMDELLIELANNWTRNSDHTPHFEEFDRDVLNGIKQMLVDFIVHGVALPGRGCSFFGYFDPQRKLLMEFDERMKHFNNYSLCRCAPVDDSFYPNGFQLLPSTPGDPNACSETKLNQQYYIIDCKENPLEKNYSQPENLKEGQPCRVFINELNTGSPGIVQNQDFIELFVYCSRPSKKNKKSLQGYKLIGISAGSGASDKMLIDLVVILWNSQWNKDMFFTVGTPQVQNADITTDSSFVLYRNKFRGTASNNQQFMWTGSRHLHAIALLYKQSNNFPEIFINAKNPYMMVTDEIKDLIKNNLVDLVVYGRRAPYDNCALFSDLYDEYTTDYVLREFDNTAQQQDRTLNRCTDNYIKAFVPNHFKLGLPTPGAANDCTGTNFMLESHLTNISDPLQQYPFDSDDVESNLNSLMSDESSQCTTSFDSSTYAEASTSAASIETAIDEENSLAQSDSCSSIHLGANDGNIAEELDISNSRKRRLSDTFDYAMELEWETTKYFE